VPDNDRFVQARNLQPFASGVMTMGVFALHLMVFPLGNVSATTPAVAYESLSRTRRRKRQPEQ